jgi:hypothetical protein
MAIFGDENRLKPEPVYIGLWSNIGERGYRALTNESVKLEIQKSRLVAPSLSRRSEGCEAGQGCVVLQEDTEGTVEVVFNQLCDLCRLLFNITMAFGSYFGRSCFPTEIVRSVGPLGISSYLIKTNVLPFV